MISVGVTGGIGSGKTTVCKIFASMGIPVYYADYEAKRLMTYDAHLKSKIRDLLGPSAYHRNGRLNRAHVASIVFSDKEKLEALNQLVHPAVRHDAARWTALQTTKYCLQEAALLVENGSYKQLDRLIVVTAPVQVRIDRVISRDNSDREAVQRRIENQLPESKKVAVADFVIDNGGKQSLIQQIWEIHKQLIS